MKYRIIQNKYPDGRVDFRAEKKVLCFWVEVWYPKPFPEPAIFKSAADTEAWIIDGCKSNRIDLTPVKSIVNEMQIYRPL
jgi:hypothetical protein